MEEEDSQEAVTQGEIEWTSKPEGRKRRILGLTEADLESDGEEDGQYIVPKGGGLRLPWDGRREVLH